jgi:hypothetical protein
MPKATIYEHYDAFVAEYEIGLSEKSQAPTPADDAMFAKEGDQSQLRGPVSAPTNRRHHRAPFCSGENILHESIS